ncbi:substrate-binding domain-containing protein [Tabrizicola sp.]|uniref:substrate-binding domain-containing protein n=1 Tax=Tabrizicola sp. TaxID=2005166 RepID=UPI00261F7CA1|nr:substrate-binding domain-containing protein [Tabrizicola sp.]MDM7931756.1 substrate-binding domain-containing protein [Tabrizicola sp.]
MRKLIILAVVALGVFSSAAVAEGKKIGVSWSNFQEPRWKFDAAAMRSSIQRDGNQYVTANAEASAEKQMNDIRTMIEQGVDALVILPVDREAILPAIDLATAAGIPVISYDRLIEDSRVFYITFDNVGVGRIIAAMVRQVRPDGNYVILKGDPADANVGFLRQGMEEVIGAAVAGGSITIVGEANADGWRPDSAYAAMEKILADNGNKVDAVLAQNDGIAGAVIEALAAQGLSIPVGGQDGDPAALNRVARGTQVVSVWKNNRELGKVTGKVAGLLADGVTMDRVPDSIRFSGGEKGLTFNAILLNPTPITRDNLNLVIEADHITKREACAGALPGVKGC